MIGRSGAGVVIVEYGDIDCSVCAAVHEGVVPELIARYVASGRATLELRPVATSVRSGALARGAYAAGRQGRGWDFVQLAYRRARAGSGAAAEAPAALAAALGLNVSRWRADLHRRQWQLDLRAAREVASVAGFGSYPVFLVRAAGSSGSTSQPAPYTVLGPRQTIAQLRRAIARASAGRH